MALVTSLPSEARSPSLEAGQAERRVAFLLCVAAGEGRKACLGERPPLNPRDPCGLFGYRVGIQIIRHGRRLSLSSVEWLELRREGSDGREVLDEVKTLLLGGAPRNTNMYSY